MATTIDRQEYTFQAEIKQVLHLLSHSLYQSREIALRELISNASDALDKMRYISLTDEAQRDSGPLEIVLEGREAEQQLVIRDTGIGMTHDELVANLGTIAHSGSGEFLKALASAKSEQGKGRTVADRPVRRGVLCGVHDRRPRAGANPRLCRRVGLGVGVGRDRDVHHHARRRKTAARHRGDPSSQGRRQGLRLSLADQGDRPALFELRSLSDPAGGRRRGHQRSEADLGRAQEPGHRRAVHPVLPAPDPPPRGKAALASAHGGRLADPVSRDRLLPADQPRKPGVCPARARFEPVRQARAGAKRLQGAGARIPPVPARAGRFGGLAAQRLARDLARQ